MSQYVLHTVQTNTGPTQCPIQLVSRVTSQEVNRQSMKLTIQQYLVLNPHAFLSGAYLRTGKFSLLLPSYLC
jgi:hypothetical protein